MILFMETNRTADRSIFWSTVHDRCLSRLTDSFQFLNSLKFAPTDGDLGYADLVTWGFAEERRTPIARYGIACGETIEYRRTGIAA